MIFLKICLIVFDENEIGLKVLSIEKVKTALRRYWGEKTWFSMHHSKIIFIIPIMLKMLFPVSEIFKNSFSNLLTNIIIIFSKNSNMFSKFIWKKHKKIQFLRNDSHYFRIFFIIILKK